MTRSAPGRRQQPSVFTLPFGSRGPVFITPMHRHDDQVGVLLCSRDIGESSLAQMGGAGTTVCRRHAPPCAVVGQIGHRNREDVFDPTLVRLGDVSTSPDVGDSGFVEHDAQSPPRRRLRDPLP